MTVKILKGDCRDVLATLPADSVHCVVTSPPYWGLRDYGTAKWEGGDPTCDHKDSRSTLVGTTTTQNHSQESWGDYCRKCGARRVDSQIGLESTFTEFIDQMVRVFREIRRVLRPDGTLWLNLGDSYASSGPRGNGGWDGNNKNPDGTPRLSRQAGDSWGGSTAVGGLKPKDLCGIPWRVALALQADGWWLRQDIIWSKPNPMPESVTDRCTKSHEYVFLMSKSARYYWDAEAIREPAEYGRRNWSNVEAVLASATTANDKRPDHGVRVKSSVTGGDPSAGRNKRSVWEIATHAYPEAHFATFPPALVEPCIKAGTSEKGCCAMCGAPWERQVELTEEYAALLASGKAWRDGAGKPDSFTNRQPKDHPSQVPQKNRTLGWSPSCTCQAPVVPCTVLDPFGGSGTTGLVADRLQRNAILIELSPQYAAMAERRIHNDAPLFAQMREAAE